LINDSLLISGLDHRFVRNKSPIANQQSTTIQQSKINKSTIEAAQ